MNTKTAQELWFGRVMAGTWTPEYLVPEMQEAARSAAAAVESYKKVINGAQGHSQSLS